MAKGKYLLPQQVNQIQGLVKMTGEHSGTLALKLGLSRSTLISTMNGHRRHPAARLALAEFLGRPVAELFGGNGEIPPDPPLAKGGAPGAGAWATPESAPPRSGWVVRWQRFFAGGADPKNEV